MEKEKFFTHEGNGIEIPQPWNFIFGMGIQASELNCTSDQLLFESTLSSIVSSPANSHPGIPIPGGGDGGGGGESIVLRELIGRLGSICNSGEISPQSCINGNNSTTNSCYNTPLNSPPNLNLSITDQKIHGNSSIPGNHRLPQAQFPTDPGFVERAARLSTFGNKIEFPHMMESGKLSRVSSSQSFKTVGSQFIRMGDSMEESSVSETELGMKGGQSSNNTNGRKRKGMIPKGKGKETHSSTTSAAISVKDDKVVAEVEKVESDAKRSKSNEEKKGNEKAAEAPKDYIHVRARRGQATDSHSLAERVRREKISERMKFLQDLVPGCNKVTGKALMLDEIINYVQSLQRQVELLSMKLATINPRLDASMEALLAKDMLRPQVSVPTAMNPNPFDASIPPFSYGFQSQDNSAVSNGPNNSFSMNPLMAAIHGNSIMKPSHNDGFGQASTLWENDLQSVVKMALGQDLPKGFHGQMKVEL